MYLEKPIEELMKLIEESGVFNLCFLENTA